MALHIGDHVEPRGSHLGPGRIHDFDDLGGVYVIHERGEHIRWTADQIRPAAMPRTHTQPALFDLLEATP